jgi:hypothetical protein
MGRFDLSDIDLHPQLENLPRATALLPPASLRLAKLSVLLVLVGHKSYPSPRSANLIGNFLTSNYFHKF